MHTVSGYIQVAETDIYSDHDYHQDPDVLAQDLAGLEPDSAWSQKHTVAPDLFAPYRGQLSSR